MTMADIKYIDLKDNDSVEFHIYPDLSLFTEDEQNIFSHIDELMGNINKIIEELSKNYIWHNEEFRISQKNLISAPYSGIEKEPFSFYGTLNYGENIEDEWFTVFLLTELTKEIEGLIVSVKDGDGEFLLIEAAEHLPSWITPETSEGKTFLYKGELHVLPLSYKTESETFKVTEEVLKYIRENSDKIKCDNNVQKAIQDRISGFPHKTEINYHNAILYVPVGVASLLNANEKYVAPAVRAFCERDLLDIKACRAMKYFPPENRVYTPVKFTKLLYVMLATSKYLPDKRTGWNLPQPTNEDYKSQLLGIKLACGFEILINQAKDESCKGDSEESDFSNDPNWKMFLNSLKAKNYFRGLLEHSKQYNQLLETAKEYYSNSCGNTLKPSKAREILDTFDKIDVDLEELKKKEASLPKSDDDGWMNITRDELDSLLKTRFGCDDVAGVGDDRFEVAQHLDDFINHTSGIEGAEFPTNCKTKTMAQKPRTNKKRKTVKFSADTKLADAPPTEAAANSGSINFEPDGFINAIKNILDFSIPDDDYWDSEGSGMSSYEDEPDLDVEEKTKTTSKKKDNVLIHYMKEMDKEISNTMMGQSFVTKKGNKDNKDCEDSEELKPVDIDMNALKNIISSYRAQMGEPGPAENILGPFGVKLDDIKADLD